MKNKDIDKNTIFELLNYAEIDNSYNEDFQLDKLTYKRIEKKMKKKLYYKRRKVKYFVSAMMFMCLVIATVNNTAFANGISVPIFEKLKILRSGNYVDLDKYTQNVYSYADDQGVRFAVNKVISDDNEIMLSYIVIGDKNKEEAKGIVSANFRINGEDIEQNQISSGGSDEILWQGVFELKAENGNFLDSFELNVDVVSIGDLKGSWKLNLMIDKKQASKDTKEYNINKDMDIGEDKINIKKIITSPLSTDIEITDTLDGKYRYFIFDDKGNIIKYTGLSSYSNSEVSYEKLKYCSLISKETKELTFLPYEEVNEVGDPLTYDISRLPLEIPQGTSGKLVINRLEWNKDNLNIYYTADGEVPLIQAENMYLLDNQNRKVFGQSVGSDESNQHDFMMNFKGVNKNTQYKICMRKIEDMYKLHENYKFTIDLK